MFDAESGELTRGGVPVRLQPQPARVLAVLLERAGEVVPRDELRRRIWDGDTHVDFERGLNFCIAQIRSALGDSAESPRFIETLPKRGYRFVAPVRSCEADAQTAMADPLPGGHRRAWLRSGALALAGIGVIAALGTLLATRGAIDGRIRVAVVPFDNETGLDSYADLAQGIADATVARLAAPGRVDRLAVIGNAAALRRPRSFRDLKQIGEDVNAEYVVLAQVKRDESRVRLIAHLIRVQDEAHVWAETFDRPAFTLEAQGEIAEAIASAVAGRLSSE